MIDPFLSLNFVRNISPNYKVSPKPNSKNLKNALVSEKIACSEIGLMVNKDNFESVDLMEPKVESKDPELTQKKILAIQASSPMLSFKFHQHK